VTGPTSLRAIMRNRSPKAVTMQATIYNREYDMPLGSMESMSELRLRHCQRLPNGPANFSAGAGA